MVTSRLEDAGFDRSMSANERSSYLTDSPLISDATKTEADKLAEVQLVVVCYPLIFGVCPPRVKNWTDRAFVLDVAFEFDRKNRVRGAMRHLKRTLVVGVTDRPARRHHRLAYGPYLARSFFLHSNMRSGFKYIETEIEQPGAVLRRIDRW